MIKFKILPLNLGEIEYFESFLNSKANEGWNLSKSFLNRFWILKFEYKPELQRNYRVIYNQNVNNFQFITKSDISNKSSDNQFKEMLSDFGVETLITYGYFDVLVSDSSLPLFNDHESIEEIKSNLIKSQIKNNLIFTICFGLITILNFSLYNDSIVSLLSDISIFTLSIYTSFTIQHLFKLYTTIKLRRGWTPLKSNKFNNLSNVNFVSLAYLIFISFYILVLIFALSNFFKGYLSPTLLIATLIMIFFIYMSWSKIDNYTMPKLRRILAKSFVVLIFTWINLYFNTRLIFNSLDSTSIESYTQTDFGTILCEDTMFYYNDSSQFVEKSTLGCKQSSYATFYVYRFKNETLSPFLKSKIMNEKNLIDGTLYVNHEVSYSNEDYSWKTYYLITPNLIIESDQPFTNEVIAKFNKS